MLVLALGRLINPLFSWGMIVNRAVIAAIRIADAGAFLARYGSCN